MAPRLPPLHQPPTLFAHRGARAHAPDNTIEAFELALRLGATGLESDVWLTADGVPVLDHDGVIGRWPRRRNITELRRDEVPGRIPSLTELFVTCGTDFELSLDLKDPDAFDAVLGACRSWLDPSRLWLCHPDLEVLLGWRDRTHGARLVHSTRAARFDPTAERHVAELAAAGIDTLNMPFEDWSGGLVALCHRFERRAWAWNANHDHQVVALLHMGVDAVMGDHVDRLSDAFGQIYGPV